MNAAAAQWGGSAGGGDGGQGAMNEENRLLEAKERVERLKERVRATEVALADAKATSTAGWGKISDLRRANAGALDELAEAKKELRRLSADGGSAAKWVLAAKAWVVLADLEDRGVDVGPAGRALMDEIEFMVPPARLAEARALVQMSATATPQPRDSGRRTP